MRQNNLFRAILIGIVAFCSASTALAQCDGPAQAGRFRLRGVEMIDTRTELVWLRCPEGRVAPSGTCDSSTLLSAMNWDAAMRPPVRTPQLPAGAWRLPSLEELETIGGEGCDILYDAKYFNLRFATLWTSSQAGGELVWLLGKRGRVLLRKTLKGHPSGVIFFAQAVYVRNAGPRELKTGVPARVSAAPAVTGSIPEQGGIQSAGQGQPSSLQSSMLGPTVAYVDGRPVLKIVSDMWAEMSRPGSGAAGLEAAKADAVNSEVVAQHAAKSGVGIYPDATKISTANRDQVWNFIIQQQSLIRKYLQGYLTQHPVAEPEIWQEYERVRQQTGVTEYHAAHILVGTRAEAQALIERLQRGESIGALAAASADLGSRDKGGDLGWHPPSVFDKDFADALVRLAAGSFTSEPVRTRYGWHVIKVLEVRPLQFPAYEALKERIRQNLELGRTTSHISALRAKAQIAEN